MSNDETPGGPPPTKRLTTTPTASTYTFPWPLFLSIVGVLLSVLAFLMAMQTQRQMPVIESTVEVVVEDCLLALSHADEALDIYVQTLTASETEMDIMAGELERTLTNYYITYQDCLAAQ